MDEEFTITVRFKGDKEMLDNLVIAWLENEGITISAGGKHYVVDPTYVKER